MSNLADIVKVDIDLNSPVVDGTSFDNLLIVGPGPRIAPSAPPPANGVYSTLDEVNEAGWKSIGESADPVGVAAMVAFAQSPQPSSVYIAVQQYLEQLIQNVEAKIITSENADELLPVGGYETPPTTLPWLQVAFKHLNLVGGELSIMVEKDGTLVYGGNITKLAASDSAYFQAQLGETTEAGEIGLGLETIEQDGEYAITLEATLGGQTTIITQTVSYTDGMSKVAETIESDPELEHPNDTLSRALDYTGWYVICPAGIPESQFEEIAQWTEAQTKLFAYTYVSDEDPVGAVYYRSFGWFGKETPKQTAEDIPPANLYLHVAAVADCLAYESGSETWAFKSLSSVYPSVLSSTQMKALKDGNLNYYTTYANKNITQNGKVKAGEWIDIIRFRDWLQNDMQIRILNLLVMNPKIPYTNSGIGLVENQMIASLKAGMERGGVAPDEYDEDGNVIPGYIVTVPNSASLTASQKASRVLTGCKFKARIAGAIHAVEVGGSLTYSY